MQQHYITRAYLEGFTDPDCPPADSPYVWTFSFGRKEWKRRAPKNLAKRADLYALTDEKGNKNQVFEELLSAVESQFARVMRGSIAARSVPTGDDRGVIAEFAALLLVRLPAQHEEMGRAQKAIVHEIIKEKGRFYRENPAEFEVLKEDLRKQGHMVPDSFTPEAFTTEGLEVAIPRNAILIPAFEIVPRLAEEIFSMSWMYYRTSDTLPFVTSDWPLALYSPTQTENLGLKYPTDVEVTLPLSRTIALSAVWGRRDLGFRYATRNTVKAINLRSCAYARHFAIASKRAFPGAKAIVKKFATQAPA